ncbi:hypothetical protein ALNOE001_08650 [Candidatus Methanobinarius endosymbioticus]|uniref:Uncharacterized protein n=1 Tax=Candidatus Methanobinarius endosymbioticus TaxID=2006182 RepID=A0A366MBH2_9EURY|nr:hypothetical protein ALNOE001_08650 [Candidatus Methanobinarius endosymbioticus]
MNGTDNIIDNDKIPISMIYVNNESIGHFNLDTINVLVDYGISEIILVLMGNALLHSK